MFSLSLPLDSYNAEQPVPSFIFQAFQNFFQLGTQKMFSANILLSLQPTNWIVAFAALTIPHFDKEHMATSAQVRQDFDFHILAPIKTGNFDAVFFFPPPPISDGGSHQVGAILHGPGGTGKQPSCKSKQGNKDRQQPQMENIPRTTDTSKKG